MSSDPAPAPAQEDQGCKPLPEDCKAYIIHYMTYGQRFQIDRMPALTKLNRETPLRIHCLQFDPSFLIIDELKWSYTSILESSHGMPNWAKEANQRGGLPYDVDRYGREDLFQGLQPGDIVIPRAVEKAQPPQNRFKRDRQVFNVFVKFDLTNTFTEKVEVGCQHEDEKIRDLLRNCAIKQLGGCPGKTHTVHTLKVDTEGGILRLPENFYIRTKRVSFPKNAYKICIALLKILDRGSFPFHQFQVRVTGPDDIILKYFMLKEAEEIQLFLPKGAEKMSWNKVLGGLWNSKIQLFDHEIPMVGIIKQWKKTAPQRKIGSIFSVCVENEYQILMDLQKELEACTVEIPERRYEHYPYGLSIPINKEKELNLYIEPQPYCFKVHETGTGMMFQVVMEVMAKGSGKVMRATEEEEEEDEEDEEEDEEEEHEKDE